MYNSCNEYSVAVASSREIAEMKEYEEKSHITWQAAWILYWITVKIKLSCILILKKKGSGKKKEKLQLQYEWRPGWFCETA